MPKVGQKTVPASDSAWKTEKIRLGGQDVEAKRLGALAVHLAVPPREGWGLTHVASALSISEVGTEEDALRIGEYLWSNCCLLFRESQADTIRKQAPAWVKIWCVACRAHGKWMDPAKYREDG